MYKKRGDFYETSRFTNGSGFAMIVIVLRPDKKPGGSGKSNFDTISCVLQ